MNKRHYDDVNTANLWYIFFSLKYYDVFVPSMYIQPTSPWFSILKSLVPLVCFVKNVPIQNLELFSCDRDHINFKDYQK